MIVTHHSLTGILTTLTALRHLHLHRVVFDPIDRLDEACRRLKIENDVQTPLLSPDVSKVKEVAHHNTIGYGLAQLRLLDTLIIDQVCRPPC